MPKTKVLILCTGNSARSQMAEGLLRHEADERFEVYSAGTKPSMVRTEAIAVMQEIGIDISHQRSKSVDEFVGQDLDDVITVCDNARESCPVFPAKTRKIHWPFEDPAAVRGSEDERNAAFRKVRDQIHRRIMVFLREDSHESLNALVERVNDLRQKVEAGADFDGKQDWLDPRPKLPVPVAQLTECLLQGVDAPAETVANALQLVAFFAQGCRSKEDWRALSVGPYGKELLHQAWLLYEPMQWPEETWLRNTCAVLAAYRHEPEELSRLIQSEVREEIGLGLLACAGLLWTAHGACAEIANAMPLEEVESRMFLEDPALCEAAIWTWASILRERRSPPQASPRNLDRLTSIWLGDTVATRSFHTAAYAICQNMGLSRDAWSPALTEAQAGKVRLAAYPSTENPDLRSTSFGAALVVAFHAGNVWGDDELAALLAQAINDRRIFIRGPAEDRRRLTNMLEQMGRNAS